MEKITDYFKSVYLPHDEFRLISQMYIIIGEGIQNIFYKRYFDSLSDNFQKIDADRIWHLYTVNAYYDTAIRDWCMIFGSYSEPTHYSNLLNYPGIRAKLEIITSANNICRHELLIYILDTIDYSSYETFHTKTKDYRDRYLNHREHHPTIIKDGDILYPELKICEETLTSIYLFLIKLANLFPDEPNQSCFHKHTYYNLSSADQIKRLMENNFLPLSFVK